EYDAEPAPCQTEQHLSGRGQLDELCRAQLLQLDEYGGVPLRTLPARPVQDVGVVPHLRPGLGEHPLGGGPVERSEEPVEQGDPARRAYLVVLGADPGQQHGVHVRVVARAGGAYRRVVEVLRGDDGDQGLRQIVVDVRVHAEQDVAQRREFGAGGRGLEGDAPRLGYPAAVERGVERVEVQLREGDVPALQPRSVLEATLVDLFGDRPGGPEVRVVEVAPGV